MPALVETKYSTREKTWHGLELVVSGENGEESIIK